MSIVSQEEVIQDELIQIHQLLLKKKELIKAELTFLKSDFDRTYNGFINIDVSEEELISSKTKHQHKLYEYDFYSHIIDIINDFKDIYGQFPEYREMQETLEQTMRQLANNEKYELAAILKPWVDKITTAISKE